jgi:dihydroorotate dehydrogenase
VKIAPDLSEEELIQVADSLVRHNIDGVIATNTTLDRALHRNTNASYRLV